MPPPTTYRDVLVAVDATRPGRAWAAAVSTVRRLRRQGWSASVLPWGSSHGYRSFPGLGGALAAPSVRRAERLRCQVLVVADLRVLERTPAVPAAIQADLVVLAGSPPPRRSGCSAADVAATAAEVLGSEVVWDRSHQLDRWIGEVSATSQLPAGRSLAAQVAAVTPPPARHHHAVNPAALAHHARFAHPPVPAVAALGAPGVAEAVEGPASLGLSEAVRWVAVVPSTLDLVEVVPGALAAARAHGSAVGVVVLDGPGGVPTAGLAGAAIRRAPAVEAGRVADVVVASGPAAAAVLRAPVEPTDPTSSTRTVVIDPAAPRRAGSWIDQVSDALRSTAAAPDDAD